MQNVTDSLLLLHPPSSSWSARSSLSSLFPGKSLLTEGQNWKRQEGKAPLHWFWTRLLHHRSCALYSKDTFKCLTTCLAPEYVLCKCVVNNERVRESSGVNSVRQTMSSGPDAGPHAISRHSFVPSQRPSYGLWTVYGCSWPDWRMYSFFVFILFYCEAGSSVAQAGFELSLQPRMPWSSDPPDSTSCVLRLQVYTTMPSLFLPLFKEMYLEVFWMALNVRILSVEPPWRLLLKTRNPWGNHKGPLRRILILLTHLVWSFLIFSSIQGVSIECPALNISNGAHALLLIF